MVLVVVGFEVVCVVPTVVAAIVMVVVGIEVV